MRPVLHHLDDRQKERFLFSLLRGEIRICFAQTEPDAGTDPAAMKTRAVRDGDNYIVSGTKRFITAAGGPTSRSFWPQRTRSAGRRVASRASWSTSGAPASR